MKNNTANKPNPFSLLGLDPYYLRRLPDKKIEALVKAVFRILIMYYHDDTREFKDSHEREIRKAKFEESYGQVLHAFEQLSTPIGRLEAFNSFRGSTTSKLRMILEETEKKLDESVEQNNGQILSMLLNSVGVLKEEDKLHTPIHLCKKGNILVSKNFNNFYDLSIDSGGNVADFAECFFVPARDGGEIKKGLWFFPGTPTKVEGYMVAKKEREKPQVKLKVVGSLPSKVYRLFTERISGALDGQSQLKKTPTIPFLRLYQKEMSPYLHQIEPCVNKHGALVMIDNNGIFYIAGLIYGSRSPKESKKK